MKRILQDNLLLWQVTLPGKDTAGQPILWQVTLLGKDYAGQPVIWEKRALIALLKFIGM